MIEFVKDCPAFRETRLCDRFGDRGSRRHLILDRDPNLTVLRGVVTDGAWNGVQLVGATVHAQAVRLGGTTLGGFLRILPATAG